MDSNNHKILFVEDISDTRDLVEFALKQDGFDVKTVQTAHEGLAQAREGNFSLILVDIGLPDQDGLALCREIRAFDERTPILFYTAYAELLDPEAAFKAGAQGWLRKPEDTERLGEVVKSYIERGQA